jgi:hypothetical protein
MLVHMWGGGRSALGAIATGAAATGSGGDRVTRLGALAQMVASGRFELVWAWLVKGRGLVLPRWWYCTSGPAQ